MRLDFCKPHRRQTPRSDCPAPAMLQDHLCLCNCRMRPESSIAWHAQMVSKFKHKGVRISESNKHVRCQDAMLAQLSFSILGRAFPYTSAAAAARKACPPCRGRGPPKAPSTAPPPSIKRRRYMSGQAAGTTLLSSNAASKASSTDIVIQASSSSGWLEAISASLATVLRIVVGNSQQTPPTPRHPTARMMTFTI